MEQMELFSDEALAVFVPIVVYWLYSALYLVLGKSMDKYRLHSRLEEDSKNLVSKRHRRLIMQQSVGLLAFVVSGMSPRASIYFFSFCTVKAIDDHCGTMLPWNVFHRCFWNNTAYHDLHHQLRGGKYNFSQPFFVTWDKVFGTHMPYVVEARPEGGLQARPQKATVSCSDKQN
ncbi:hypothetical protein PR202_gb17051 [Eleusine coracana subsp. coracana]|uniref:aldehyde oxygenase (deformylating) n=1 Tax=Eleusine coracana subsp. coracana TaxID=191504 RepID=A0AAV5F1X2_ELECO|nr:hypothetical protein QOZ80_6BG0471580 [Eleusine coracana subsp. coracana]GJN28879.1 hypothetical protein PR202_gb17051 [Eleusine coracana subsp. coracana]